MCKLVSFTKLLSNGIIDRPVRICFIYTNDHINMKNFMRMKLTFFKFYKDSDILY